MAKAEYFACLGHTPAYTGNPTPPIIAERVFGHSSPSPPTVTGDGMDVNNTPFAPNESPPPLIACTDENFTEHYHPIPDNDFQANIDLDDLQPEVEPYNEDFEITAVEDELRAFSEIRYGSLLNIPKNGLCIEVLIDLDRGKYP